MSTTKRESLRQVQKSYQHAILLHPQGSHPKKIKILAQDMLFAWVILGVKTSKEKRKQKTFNEPKFLYCKKLSVRSYLKTFQLVFSCKSKPNYMPKNRSIIRWDYWKAFG